MILCVGEILADLIGCERDGAFSYERKAGGAPFNVACGIQKFGGEAAFTGSVGDDLIGRFLIDFAKERKLNKLNVAYLPDKNTTLAFVQLDKSGERSFCFYRKNTADYHLPEISDKDIREADTVYIGSLMLSEDCGFRYAKKLAKRAHALKRKVAFDVNFRTDIFRNREDALSRYKVLLEAADIIKFSEEEVAVFGESYIEEKLKDKLLCISLGEKGSQWRYGGKAGNVATVAVKAVDTTGAGDAFFAGVLKGLDKVPLTGLSDGFLNGVFKEANVCGALNTLGRGAIDCLPDRKSIEAALKKLPQ